MPFDPDRSSFKTYLSIMVRSIRASRYRSRMRHPEAPLDGDMVDPDLPDPLLDAIRAEESRQFSSTLGKCLLDLPPHLLTVFCLHKECGLGSMGGEQLKELLGVASATITRYKDTALRLIREGLESRGVRI